MAPLATRPQKADSEIFNKFGPASVAAGVRCVIMTSCPTDSRESWREQDRTPDQVARSQFQKERPNVPVVTDDHKVLGLHFQQDQFGGFVTYPLLTEIVDEQMFENLKKEGLENADARHLMYAICNDCDRFITLDKHFLNR